MATDTTKGRKPKEKRAYGEGGIFQRQDGSEDWIGTTRYEDPETGERKKHFVYGKTRKEVAAKKKAFEDALKEGILPKSGKTTVSQWLDTWLETYAKIKIKPNTYDCYKQIIEAHLKKSSIGNTPLKNLRPDQVQKMLNEKLQSGNLRQKGKPLSPRQVELIYSVLHSAMERAVKDKLVTRNVCDAVEKPKQVKHEFMPWTVEETNKFLTVMKGTRLFPLYMVAWGAGLRRAELAGLQWPDIDLKKGTLTVRRVYVRVKGGHIFQDPKTTKSRRTIPLPAAVVDELKAWKARQAQDNMNWKGLHKDLPDDEKPEYNPKNMVFCDEVGEPLQPDFISHSFKRDIETAGVTPIRFHDLRHGHATMLLELGEDLKVISERLGHSTITLTADTYGHVREKMQREAADKLNGVLNLKKKSR